MAGPEYHRRRLATWRRVALAMPLVAVLLSEYLLGTRLARPDLFWGAVTVTAFFATWAVLAAVWHYLILDGIDGSLE